MRWVMTRVLPLPAPATTSTGPVVAVTASRCEELRGRRRVSAVTSECGMRPYDTTALQGRGPRLLHRDRLREVARLIDVASKAHRDVVGQELKRNHHEDGRQQVGRRRHLDHRVGL